MYFKQCINAAYSKGTDMIGDRHAARRMQQGDRYIVALVACPFAANCSG